MDETIQGSDAACTYSNINDSCRAPLLREIRSLDQVFFQEDLLSVCQRVVKQNSYSETVKGRSEEIE